MVDDKATANEKLKALVGEALGVTTRSHRRRASMPANEVARVYALLLKAFKEELLGEELAITAAMEAVEDAGCNTLLTEAVILLAEARDKVADFVDSAPSDSAKAKSSRIAELRNARNREHGCKNPIISGTQSGMGDFTTITCICGHQSHTTGKDEACA